MEPFEIDLSTLDQAKLATLSLVKSSKLYQLRPPPSSTPLLMPPGHPSYFLRKLEGAGAAKDVILSEAGKPRLLGKYAHDLESLYKIPLFSSPRTQAWARMVFGYFADCYVPEDRSLETDSLIFQDFVPSSNQEGSIKNQRLAEQFPVERYRPLVFVRSFYPEWVPTSEEITYLVENAGYGPMSGIGDWWQQYNRKPLLVECEALGHTHNRVTDKHCRFCGWKV